LVQRIAQVVQDYLGAAKGTLRARTERPLVLLLPILLALKLKSKLLGRKLLGSIDHELAPPRLLMKSGNFPAFGVVVMQLIAVVVEAEAKGVWVVLM